jgi:2-oxoglutarate dehydrogenase E1 component
MSGQFDPALGINSWLEDELYQQYLNDRRTVDESWKHRFEDHDAGNGHEANGGGVAVETLAPSDPLANGTPAVTVPAAAAPAPPPEAPPLEPGPGETLIPLRGAAARIAENMTVSLGIPTATSQRTIAVKVIDENRRVINEHRTIHGLPKISYTHIAGWAVVKALADIPAVNNAYVEHNGQAFRRVRSQVNLGVAVDVQGKDGNRSLTVPNVKNAGAISFAEYVQAFDDVVSRARKGKLTLADFEGTSVSLTNPGTVGTAGSIPRLMPGQGAIIATGAIDFPAEYQGVTDEMKANLGLSKVMTVTCTYDHRVVQGAESGAFLGRLQELLQGKDGFYDEIFDHLKIPYRPVYWEEARPALAAPGAFAGGMQELARQASVLQLINAYRVRGHLIGDLDPLGKLPTYHPELDPATYGLTIWDRDRQFITGTLMNGLPTATLREILERLRRTYCGRLGCEYMNIQHPEQKEWLQARMEPAENNWTLTESRRRRALHRLLEAEEFEHFLHARFIGHKRFSLEGAESAMPILDELLERAANHNVHETVIGMAHRGRLTVLANLVGKSMIQLFSEFEGDVDPTSMQGSGDVKYHLGATGVRKAESGREIVVTVAFNPSHLEAVDPVVEGLVRPKQDRLGDTNRERVIPILIHGDAAFAGQGVVAETLNLSQLEGYTTGGTIHLIINNQIGFTTNPAESRSTPYPTDVARMVQAPIFHVNGDDPEACLRAAEIAFDYRQKFKKDVVIDMICYRRHGHNEADDPSYTQPLLYQKIRQHPSVAVLYSQKLQREGLVPAEEIERERQAVNKSLNEVYEIAQQSKQQYELQELSGVSAGEIAPFCPTTAVDRGTLERVVQGMTSFPPSFHLHPKLRNFVERRREALEGAPMDWATAESLAFGSLVLEGTPVRLSGQDSARGTFSQRHLEYYDYENGKQYIPLQHLAKNQARFDVWDSSLSEYAVMGFEFGYSVGDPLALVLWEAQFGDFANGAQIMIDQFIVAAESKWGQPSGLVLLLPHGYEGQGPEHSSARIERFLQLAAEGNIQVANCSTPAQYFHLLRRQMHGGADRRGVRKPLIVFTPKSLLRHPKAVSRMSELTSGGFREIMGETANLDPARISKLLVCSGKAYYDLLAAREQREIEDVAILRLEQLYPFNSIEFSDILLRYPLTAEVLWVQEEPRNMGAWRFIQDQIQPLLNDSRRTLRYAGRPESASPSAGSLKRHQQEQVDLIEEAFSTAPVPRPRRRLVPKKRK